MHNYKSQRQLTITKSIDTVIFKLTKQQQALEKIVKHYSSNKDTNNNKHHNHSDFKKKKIKSLELKPKKLTLQLISTQQKTLKLPLLNQTPKPQIQTPKYTPKFNTLQPKDKEQTRKQFILKAYTQRETLTNRNLHMKRQILNLNSNILQKRMLKICDASKQSSDRELDEECPIPLQDYFKELKQIIQKQVREQIQLLNQQSSKCVKKQNIISLLEEHDRQIRKLRKRSKHLEHFDLAFFTKDMFNN